MDWVILALLSALFLATSDALTKKAVHHNNEYLVALFRLAFSLLVLIPALFVVPWPRPGKEFYLIFCIAVPVEIITVILYIKALKLSPLSLTMPFMAMTPVFLIAVSYFILKESVSYIGGAGIVLIAAGGYLLNADGIRKGYLEPVRAIAREKGVLYMIVVAFLYSITASLGKAAIELSSPVFFGTTYFIAITLAFAPVALVKGLSDLGSFMKERRFRRLAIPGIFYGLMIVTHMSAMKLTKVAYMVSVKRTSLLIGVLYGYFLFREENIRFRLVGALLMFAGFVAIVIAE